MVIWILEIVKSDIPIREKALWRLDEKCTVFDHFLYHFFCGSKAESLVSVRATIMSIHLRAVRVDRKIW